MKKTDSNGKAYLIKNKGTLREFTVPYKFETYFLILFTVGGALVFLSYSSLSGEKETINIILKSTLGIVGLAFIYLVLVHHLNVFLSKVIVDKSGSRLSVRRGLIKRVVNFDEITEFLIYAYKREGVTNSSNTFKSPDSYICSIKVLLRDTKQFEIFTLYPVHSEGNDQKLIKSVKREGLAFAKSLGIPKEITWKGVLNQ
jgi:hypothetical protein